jgi:hypothetical protein
MTPCNLDQVTKKQLDEQVDQNFVSGLWRYAKDNYFGKGIPHHEVISQMALEFDMPERIISYALDKPKSMRKISDEARERMRETSRFLSANRRYLERFDQSTAEKLAIDLADGVRGSLLAHHGPVISQTHGIDVLFTNPGKFLRAFFRGIASMKESQVDKFMAKMTDTPEKAALHKMFYDAGAPIGREPSEGFTEHGLLARAATKYDLPFLKNRSWAAKAMDGAMKPLRFELMMEEWKKKNPDLQTKEMATLIAQQMSHATGAMLRGEPMQRKTALIRPWLLAGQLTVSKWMKAVVDPSRTIRTYVRTAESKINPKLSPPSPEERAIAWSRVKRAGIFLSVYMSALKVNDEILKAAGSNQHVNFTDPSKTDWLAYKFAGHYWRPRGALEVAGVLARMVAVMKPYSKQAYGKSPEEIMGRYAEYKAIPGISAAKELISGRDVFGRPVPWSPEPGTAKFPRLTWPEYATQKGPIWLGHGVKAAYDAAREQGIDTSTLRNVFGAISQHPEIIREALLSSGAEFLGINVQPDLEAKGLLGKPGRPHPPRPPRPALPRAY